MKGKSCISENLLLAKAPAWEDRVIVEDGGARIPLGHEGFTHKMPNIWLQLFLHV
jgi:hypothetical protein